MTTLANLNVELTASTDGLMSSLSKSQKQVQNWTRDMEQSAERVDSFFKTAFSFALGGLIESGINKISDSIGGLIDGMVGGNAQFEDYNVQFEVMLGSAELAKERLDDLAKFGARTPFELPQVVDADKVLQGFGLHSLEAAQRFGFSGEQILEIAGDVASGTGTDFQEMALNIGKFSQGATGEAIARFMELGVLTRDELSQMGVVFSKSGELMSPLPHATNAMLQIMREKYGGLMEAQSTTFNGMKSNLQDWIGNALRIMGAPIFDVLKDNLKKLLDFLSANGPKISTTLTSVGQVLAGVLSNAFRVSSAAMGIFVAGWRLISPAVLGAIDMLQTVGVYISALAKMAGGWGANIINQLAAGIRAAAGKVVQSLRGIGNIITYWLRPHSPPKLLPNLDDWGAGAATAYMDGWAEGDFSAFDDLSNQIQSHLKSLADMGQMGEDGIIPALLGSRSVVAEMISQFDQMGSVGEDAFQRLRDAAGPAADVAEELMRGYIDVQEASRDVADAQRELAKATDRVAEAQEVLNEVTARYDAELAPLNKQLDQTQRALDDIRDAKKSASLQAIIDSSETSDIEKQEAALELQEIQIKQLIRAKEDEKDIAVSAAAASVAAAEAEQRAAQAKLEAAQKNEQQVKDQYVATQKLISVQQTNNDLVKQQVDLLSRLAAEADSAAGGGGGGGGIGGLSDVMGDFSVAMEPMAMGLEPLSLALDDMTASASENQTTLGILSGTMFESVGSTLELSAAYDNIIGTIQRVGVTLLELSIPFQVIKGVAQNVFPSIKEIITSALGSIVELFHQHKDETIETVSSAWNIIQSIISGVVTVISTVISTGLDIIKGFFDKHGVEVQTLISQIWTTILDVIETTLIVIDAVIRNILIPVAQFIKDHSDFILSVLNVAWFAISNTIKITLGIIQAFINGVLTIINGDWGTAWEGIKVLTLGIWEGIKNGISQALNWIVEKVSGAWATITAATSGLFSDIGGGITGAFDAVVGRMKSIINGAIRSINSVVGALNSVSSALGFGSVIGTIPELARGTNFWGGGPAIVSEAGLEHGDIPGIGSGIIAPGLYDLPRGSKITPARQTAEMFSGGGSGGNTYNITYNRGTAEREDVIGDIQSLRIMYGGLG